MQIPRKTKAVLSVHLQLKLTDLIHKGIATIAWHEAPWTYTTYGEGANAVCSTYVKLLTIRCHRHIAIAVDSPHAGSQG